MSDTVKISDAESEVMKVLWASDGPMTEREILDKISEDNDWSPTTIKTFLKRLYDKGAVNRHKRGVYFYTPIVTEADFARERTVELLNKVFGGNAKGLVSTMLNNDIISEDDVSDLKNYWKKRKESE